MSLDQDFYYIKEKNDPKPQNQISNKQPKITGSLLSLVTNYNVNDNCRTKRMNHHKKLLKYKRERERELMVTSHIHKKKYMLSRRHLQIAN